MSNAQELPEYVPEPRVVRWQQSTDGVLMLAALAFLAAYAIPIIWPHVSTGAQRWCGWIQWATWALFAADYAVRLLLARQRVRWFLRHPLDLAAIVLPMLRPLRLLRLVTVLNIANRRATVTLRGRVATYVIGSAVLLSFVAALAVLDAERGGAESTIQTFGDAWWWAMTTMTTVGYGDLYPTTTTGRLVAAGLMIGGIALLGTVTATLASWLSDRVRDESEANEEVLTELRALRASLAERQPD